MCKCYVVTISSRELEKALKEKSSVQLHIIRGTLSHVSHWELHPWIQQRPQSRPTAREGKVNHRLTKAVGEFFHIPHLQYPSEPYSMGQSQGLLKWRKQSPWAWDVPKSCGSHLLFLNERFFLRKVYDLISQCDAKMDKLLRVCKALLQTWGSVQKRQKILSQKPQNKPVTKPLSGFSRTCSLKIWVSEPMVLLQRGNVVFRIQDICPSHCCQDQLFWAGERMNKVFRA